MESKNSLSPNVLLLQNQSPPELLISLSLPIWHKRPNSLVLNSRSHIIH